MNTPVRSTTGSTIARIRAELRDNALVGNSLALISGTVATQAIVFLFSPFLSRIFGLADFGNLANYNAWVSILALTSSLRYEHAIFVAKEGDATNRVMALTATLSLVSFVVYVALACAIAYVSPMGGYLASLHQFVLIIPLGVLAACITSLLTQLNIKTGHFRRLALVTTAQVVCTIIVQVALGIGRVENGLIIGTVVGFTVAGIALSRLSLTRESSRAIYRGVTREHLSLTAREFINFPRFTLGADAISVVAQQFIPVFILALFNPALAGLYSFSIRVVRVPLIVVATAISGALRKEAVDRMNTGQALTPLFSSTVRALFAMAIVPFMVMLLYSHQIFATVFGDKWRAAGRIVQILSPGILFEFVAYPLSVLFLVTNTQRYTFRTQLAGFAALLAALAVGKEYGRDFITTCYLVSGVMVVVNLASILLARKVSARYVTSSGHDLGGSAEVG